MRPGPPYSARNTVIGSTLAATCEKILEKRDHPAREPLLWRNGYFGRARRTIRVRGGIIAVNSPLFRNAELLDEILKYAHIPKDVVSAYRDQALKLGHLSG